MRPLLGLKLNGHGKVSVIAEWMCYICSTVDLPLDYTCDDCGVHFPSMKGRRAHSISEHGVDRELSININGKQPTIAQHGNVRYVTRCRPLMVISNAIIPRPRMNTRRAFFFWFRVTHSYDTLHLES